MNIYFFTRSIKCSKVFLPGEIYYTHSVRQDCELCKRCFLQHPVNDAHLVEVEQGVFYKEVVELETETPAIHAASCSSRAMEAAFSVYSKRWCVVCILVQQANTSLCCC